MVPKQPNTNLLDPNNNPLSSDTVPFWPMSRHLVKHQAQYQAAFEAVLTSAHLVNGPQVLAFETAWAQYCGAEFAVGVGSGFDAILLCLKVLDIGVGQRVGVPAHTCPATAMAILAAGATVVPIDVERETGNLSPVALAKLLSSQSLDALIVVNLYGRAANWTQILQVLADYPHIQVIEDNAQGHGVLADHVPARRLGSGQYAISATSFYPTKNLGALGEAGAITTNNPELAKRLKSLRDYGTSSTRFVAEEAGGNYRLDELQAAFLLRVLPSLDQFNAAKVKVAQNLKARLAAVINLTEPHSPDLISLPQTDDWGNAHLFVIRSREREILQQHLAACGIQTMVHYPCPVHLHPVFEGLSYQVGDFPEAEAWANTCFSLPCHPLLTEAELEMVVQGVAGFIRKKNPNCQT